MCIACPHLFHSFLVPFSQGQHPLDLPPDQEDCLLRLLTREQIQAAEKSMICIVGQKQAKCYFLLLSFPQQETNLFPHNPPMEAAKNKALCFQVQMSFSASLLLFSFIPCVCIPTYVCPCAYAYCVCTCVV